MEVSDELRTPPVFLVSLLLGALGVPARAAPPDPAPPAPPLIEAPEITISATRTEQSVLDVPGNVTVIDRKAIDESGVQTVPDLLRREAGIYVTNTTTDPGTFNVEARGFSNGGGNGCNTLVLVDGKRINEPDTSCPDWSFVSLDQVERIEVIRGPVSADLRRQRRRRRDPHHHPPGPRGARACGPSRGAGAEPMTRTAGVCSWREPRAPSRPPPSSTTTTPTPTATAPSSSGRWGTSRCATSWTRSPASSSAAATRA